MKVYDDFLSKKDFEFIKHNMLGSQFPWKQGTVMNPKSFNPKNLEKTPLNEDEYGQYFILPAHSYGLGVALDYLVSLGMGNIAAYEKELLLYARQQLTGMSGIRIIGNAEQFGGVVSFVMESAHPHDIGTILDTEGVAIRTGHHCTQPLMDRFDIPATARASVSFYNTKSDIDALIVAVDRVSELFG